MPLRLVSDLIVLFHFAYIIFVILGGLLAFRWRKIIWVHIPAALWGAIVEFAGWICPLTPLELLFRIRGGETAYEEGFVEHYILPLLYPAHLTREIQVALGTFVVGVNVIIYWFLFGRTSVRVEPSN
ncbi:MAG: DUF2784 domain-containing protein [Candidatus Neomarinimicrobiota bacterium]